MNAKTNNTADTANTANTAVTVKADVKKLVEKLVTGGKPYTAIHTVLVALGHADSGKAADEILSTIGVEKVKKQAKSLNARMGEWMIDSHTEEEFTSWCEVEKLNPANVRYMRAIFDSANAIHEKYAAAAKTK